jgi:MtN3 and saliva related transmembrane protein
MILIVLGLASGALTAGSFFPQVVRAARTRRTTDLSWSWLVLFATGISGWLSYGVITGDVPLIVTNAVTGSFVGVLLTMKARHALAGPAVAAGEKR